MVTLPRLRAVRKRRALSQRELARLAGVGRMTVQRIELGVADPRPSTIRLLAQALGVAPSTLMGPAARAARRGEAGGPGGSRRAEAGRARRRAPRG